MPSPTKIWFFVVICAALLVDVIFVGWATKLNFLIVVPVALSAGYLCYFAAHHTIFEVKKSDAQKSEKSSNEELDG
jgi:hypothetical protein